MPPSAARSLSGRLLLLTVAFVMLSEVLIYTPSIARFRETWLEEKLASGHLAALAVLAAPDAMVTRDLEQELLDHVGAHMVSLTDPDAVTYMLGRSVPPAPDAEVDLRDETAPSLILGAFDTLLRGGDRVLMVRGESPRDPGAVVTVTLHERPLRQAMLDYSWRILALSVVISLITAGLVFLSLRGLIVRPLARLTDRMTAFRDDPDDAASIVRPTPRADEIGVAQRELAAMQHAVRSALKQRERLAALGTAVATINHDLRNILSPATLVSERLAASADPTVRHAAERLMQALDRAVDLCSRTLDYTSGSGPPLRRARIALDDLVAAAGADLVDDGSWPGDASANGGPGEGGPGEGGPDEGRPARGGPWRPAGPTRPRWVNAVPPGLTVSADREQMLRVLTNLGRNAFQSGAGTVTVAAQAVGDRVAVTVADDGPGLPPRAREHLFQPFAGSARPGGTGLGLAIAREIVTAHRGEIRLAETGARGTTFVVDLPA